jgi:hypothetical protein
MVISNLVQDAIGGLNALNTYRPLQMLGGAEYLKVFSPEHFALILSPLLASILFPAILLPTFLGELSLARWLTVKGVNVQKWEEKRPAISLDSWDGCGGGYPPYRDKG